MDAKVPDILFEFQSIIEGLQASESNIRSLNQCLKDLKELAEISQEEAVAAAEEGVTAAITALADYKAGMDRVLR